MIIKSNEIEQARQLIKVGYGGNVDILRVYNENNTRLIVLIDILEYLYNVPRNEKRRGIETNKYTKYIKNGIKNKKELLTKWSGKQTTNLINDIALMEIIASVKGYKVLNSEESKAYNEYLKTIKKG
ncbi:hypothetical protein STFE110948_02840 [Streptobacillus felis]|uniref:hypothetical protein n=1 Tax=Streptobacillus felis TaxID=1384509 RepID=UPI0008342613|nr:hypothetical protein [Streptobacillus felis]